jgi:flagellar hook-basal body complex protein FliE
MTIQRTVNSIAPSLAQSAQGEQKTAVQDQERPSFAETMKASIAEVNQLQKQADQTIEALATGETKDVAQTMIAVEKANISFQLMTQIRNRIIEAYQEVMRMQS